MIGRATTAPLRVAATAALLVVALVGSVAWAVSPSSSVSAETILRKAGQAAVAADGHSVRSFVLARTTLAVRPWLPEEGIGSPYKPGEQYRTVSTRWFEAPDRVRDELEEAVLEPDGTVTRHAQSVTVRDGTSEWLYRPQDNTLVINVHEPAYKARDGRSPYLPAIGDVDELVQRSRACSTATLRGSGDVAGRDAYAIELGPADLARCPPVDPAWRLIGRRVVWIDKATFFPLKEERYDRADGGVRATVEVTRVDYDVPIDPERFTFTPPPGTTVRDLRPPPPPSPDEYRRQLGNVSGQAGFAVFAPNYVPPGLVPVAPKLVPEWGGAFHLEYAPPDDAELGRPAIIGGVDIVEQPASDDVLARHLAGAAVQPVPQAATPGAEAWLRTTRGATQDGHGNTSETVITDVVVRWEGTMLLVGGHAFGSEELLRVAGSLAPVQGDAVGAESR